MILTVAEPDIQKRLRIDAELSRSGVRLRLTCRPTYCPRARDACNPLQASSEAQNL